MYSYKNGSSLQNGHEESYLMSPSAETDRVTSSDT